MRSRLWSVLGVGALSFGLVLSPATAAMADSARDAQWSLKFLQASAAQQITQGEGVTVAVLDTGVDPGQVDLAGSVLPGFDDWTSARDGHTDRDGHGTRVSALIAGHGHGTDGTAGILGIAPKAKILPYAIFAPDDPERRFATAKLAVGIRWAVDHGAQVICIANAGGGSSDLELAIQYALVKGVSVVAGANNLPAVDPGFPATYSGVISLSSVDERGEFAAAVSTTGSAIRLSAPGVNIMAPKRGGGYERVSGNSAATALAAGVVALVRAKFPSLTPAQVLQRLQATAVDRGSKGWDRQYGYGTIDPVAALTKEDVGASASAPRSAAPTAAQTQPVAEGDDRDYSTGQLVAAVAMVAVCVLVVVGIVVAVVLVVRRRRRTAVSPGGPPGPWQP